MYHGLYYGINICASLKKAGYPNLFKVETLGDSYMVSSGAPIKSDDHTRDLVRFALEIRCKINLNFRITHLDNTRLRTRIGIASGPVSEFDQIYSFLS